MFSVERIDHVVRRVSDLDASVGFHCSVLGGEVATRRDRLGRVHLRAGDSMIDLAGVGGALGSRGGTAPGYEARHVDHLCLRIEPFDEPRPIAHLDEHGVASLGDADVNFGAEGEGLSLYFRDPDGNVIELDGPSTPALLDEHSPELPLRGMARLGCQM